MPTYMILMKMTPEGKKQLKERPKSIDGAIKTLEAMGGKIFGFFASSALYDFIGIGEAPNDGVCEQFRQLAMSWGKIDAQVIRLFTKDEFDKLILAIKIE